MKSLDSVVAQLTPVQLCGEFSKLSAMSEMIEQNHLIFDRSVKKYEGGFGGAVVSFFSKIAPYFGMSYEIGDPHQLVMRQQQNIVSYTSHLDSIIKNSRSELIQVQNKLDFYSEFLSKLVEEHPQLQETLTELPQIDPRRMSYEDLKKRRAILDTFLNLGLKQHQIKQVSQTVEELWGFEQLLCAGVYNCEKLRVTAEQYAVSIGEMSQSYVRIGLEMKHAKNITNGLVRAREFANRLGSDTATAISDIFSQGETLALPNVSLHDQVNILTRNVADSVVHTNKVLENDVLPRFKP